MYLVTIPPDGEYAVTWLLFFADDPRRQGCPLPVTEGVEFADAPAGALATTTVLAESPGGGWFRVFPAGRVPPRWRRHEGAVALPFHDWRAFLAELGPRRGYQPIGAE